MMRGMFAAISGLKNHQVMLDVTANDIAKGIAMLDRARDRYPWSEMQTRFPFTEEGINEAIQSALDMRSVKSTIVPTPDLLDG